MHAVATVGLENFMEIKRYMVLLHCLGNKVDGF